MKSLVPWFGLVAFVQVAFANEGLNNYRLGHYFKAAPILSNETGKDAVVDYYLAKMNLYGYGVLKNNTNAQQYFKQAGDKGWLPAQLFLAQYALKDEKYEDALYWFKKAAAGNNRQAQMYCAAAYLFGVGVKKNTDSARSYFIAAARNGDPVAQYTLAEYFLESKQESRNKNLALSWLKKAVEQGSAAAQTKLGVLFATGNGVVQDPNKAKEWFALAAAQGYVPAYYQMGELARQQNDIQSAQKWFTQGVTQHDSLSEIALAKLYLQTNSPLYNVQNGFLLMLKAAQNGSNDAQIAVAKMYQEGIGTEKNEDLAKEWQQKANASSKAANTLEDAQQKAALWLSQGKAHTFIESGYRLGGIYTPWTNPEALKENNYNQSPQMDTISRAQLFQPKFDMVNPNDVNMNEYYPVLADSFSQLKNEIDFPRYPMDIEHAKSLSENKNKQLPLEEYVAGFHNQAVLGNPEAQFVMGQMYQIGLGVQKDVKNAITYYKHAADQENLSAEYNLGLLYIEGKEIDADYQQGISWLRDAAFKGNSFAQYALAMIYELGYKNVAGEEVISPDLNQATAMYFLAANNHYGPAQFRLAELLARDKPRDVATKIRYSQLIKRMYEGAVAEGIEQAVLPLAFFDAGSSDAAKQKQAFQVVSKAAHEGNEKAALLLGILYDRGIGVEPNSKEAVYWYQKASMNPVTAFILGTYFSEGRLVRQDLEKGKSLLQQAANAKFSYANFNLAILKQKQKEDFLPELNTAISLDNSQAGILLADYYLSMDNNEQKMIEAIDIYQKLAQLGDKNAQLKLGFAYEQGLGVPLDFNKAEQWYSLAAEQGQSVAQYLLARLYQIGLNDQPDDNKAKQWYARAQQSFLPAAVALGFLYETQEDNYQQALQAYENAAQGENAVGQFNLALIYEKGKGVAVDYSKAHNLYTKSAENGYSHSMVQLAGLYLNGLGIAKDESKALDWYKKAAAMGDKDALYELGLLSEKGIATKVDLGMAQQYYQQAAEKGNEKAKVALVRMQQVGLNANKEEIHEAP